MAAKDPSCNPPKDQCTCPVWDENSLVQRCAELPSIIAAPDDILLISQGVAGGAGVAQQIEFTVPVDMLWTGSSVQSTGAFRETMKLNWEQQSIDNGVSPIVRSYLFWGGAGQPSRHAPKFLPRNKTITIGIEDIAALGVGIINTVRLAFHGFMIPKELLDVYREAFGPGKGLMRYATPRAGVTMQGNGTAGPVIQLEDACHFRHDTTCGDSTSASWEGRYSYRDVRSQRRVDMANKRIHSSLWTGCITGASLQTPTVPGRPYILPSPELCQTGSTLDFDLIDQSGLTNVAYFLFCGAREQACNPDGIAADACAR